jgi:tripartite-type tricarboxylate transporter receptor subunit TctC
LNDLRRRFLRLAAGACAAPAISRLAWGRSYPSHPVRIIVGFAAGGPNDILARLIGQRLSQRLGRPFIVENRPGAGSNLATEAVVRAPADGYTLLLVGSPNAINATLYDNLNFNFIRDIAPVAGLIRGALVMVVHASVPALTIAEFIAYAKANPGKLNFASAGIGTAPHLAAEMIKLKTGIEMTHVPYRGIGAAYPDVMSGKVQLAFSSIAGAVPFTGDQRVRPIATTGSVRSPVYPDVATVAESGLPGFDVDLWIGIFAPAGMPPAVTAKLNAEVNKVLQHPELKAAFAKIGVSPRGTSPEEGAAFVRSEYDKWKKVIVEGKIKPE